MEDGLILDLYRSVFALVEVESSPPRFLGTGFVVQDDGTFLTARHVLPGDPRPIGGVFMEEPKLRGGRPIIVGISDVRLAPEVDLASGRVDSRDLRPIRPSTKYPRLAGDVLSAEYSRSTAIDPETHKLGFEDPFVQKGHIVRGLSIHEPLFSRPTQCYELSYPALRGASGAPVVDLDDFTACGMVIANVAPHLMPAQIEAIHGEAGVIEETLFYLPHAYAVAYTEFGAVLA
jgi:Trypsin-like peptidase domain